MAGNTLGQFFRFTSFGESHGEAIGGVIDGCPSGIIIDNKFITDEMKRRKSSDSDFTSKRKEEDKVEFLSGIFDNKTTGTPIAFIIHNKNHKSSDYEHLKNIFRPSHSDYTYFLKYGHVDYRGGGRASARETAVRVAAGAIAKLFLKKFNTSINAYTSQIGKIKLENFFANIDFNKVNSNIVHCPDSKIASAMIRFLKQIKQQGDTVGGVVSCMITNCASGLGEPVFDKLQADLAKAMMSISAVKGFEYGSGFASASMKGSEHNDPFVMKKNKIRTLTNHSGGIQGGISNGENIYFNVAFKPISSIMQTQKTVDKSGKEIIFEVKGRHDVCAVPRAVPIVEAMSALVIADHYLRNHKF